MPPKSKRQLHSARASAIAAKKRRKQSPPGLTCGTMVITPSSTLGDPQDSFTAENPIVGIPAISGRQT